MNTRTGSNGSADSRVKEIRRKTRRRFSAEEKIRIVLDGLRGDYPSDAMWVSGELVDPHDLILHDSGTPLTLSQPAIPTSASWAQTISKLELAGSA